MTGIFGENMPNNPIGELTGALVVFFDNYDPTAGLNFFS
jgi:hypothetical protein